MEKNSNLERLKESDWYKERPQLIKAAIEIAPPTQYYKLKFNSKQCFIVSYDEPESQLLEDVTVTVQKTGVGGAMASMGLGQLDTNQVFGVKLTDLIPYEE